MTEVSHYTVDLDDDLSIVDIWFRSELRFSCRIEQQKNDSLLMTVVVDEVTEQEDGSIGEKPIKIVSRL
jgi:hypothetical protein